MRAILMSALLLSAPVALAGPLDGFGWFASLVGSCWVGKFPDGRTRHTQCYTSQFDRYLRGTAVLSTEQGGVAKDQFSGDSLFALDESSGRIVYYIWGSNGSHGRHEAHYSGDELVFPIARKDDPAVTGYRSVWRRIDAETFEVRRETPDGDGWDTELTVVYRKVGAAQ